MIGFGRFLAASISGTLLATVSGCSLYVPEGDIAQADIIGVTAVEPAGGYVADGQQTFDLIVNVDARTSTGKDITLTVSDGVINFAVAADDMAARTRMVRVAPGTDADGDLRKTITVPMVAGRTPGNVFVTAAVEGIQQELTLTMSPAAPDVTVMQSSVAALTLDGLQRADITATLLRDSGRVSLGTRVSFRTCCLGDQALTDCPGRTPVRVPGLVALQAGDSVAFTAVAERLTAADLGGDATPFDVYIVARPVVDGGQTAQCAGALADADTVAVQVTPLP